MPKGNELGEYSLKSTSATYQPGPAGSLLAQVNFEGTATGGFGTVAGTAAFVGGKSGTLNWCGVAYTDDGDQVNGQGEGSYESVGVHRWKTSLIANLSDGSRVMSEGEIDLASRSWTGKLYAWG